MNRERFYIFQNEDGTIYAHTADSNAAREYIQTAIAQGFRYWAKENGTAIVVTIANQGL